MKIYFSLLLMLFSGLTFAKLKITSLSDIQNNEHLITEIDLSGRGLTTFPKEILECSQLEKLNLSNNGIFNIPAELSELRYLKELDLSFNQGLSMFDLENVFETAQFQLKVLRLKECDFIRVGKNIAKQKELEELDLSGNWFSVLPYSFMNFSQLKKIDLSGNNLTDISWLISYWWELKEINLSENPRLDSEKALLALSYFDQLNKVVVSRINVIPPQFQYMNVDQLIIRDSYIEKFPRTQLSTPIRQVEFENCTFKNPARLVQILNENIQPSFIRFSDMDMSESPEFLGLEVDSVSLANVGNIDLKYLVEAKDLKWLDVRRASPVKSSVAAFKTSRSDVEFLEKEIIASNVGISPPIQKMLPKPQEVLVNASKESVVSVGNSTFSIPQDAFVREDGSIYDGDVHLEYTEYMTPVDILLSGISMTVEDDDETKMMSSGGMFSLNATDDKGNELSMNPDKSITVSMTSQNSSSDMQLWRMDEASGQWQSVGRDTVTERFKVDQAKLDSVMNQDWKALAQRQTNFYANRYIPKVKWNRKKESFELSFQRYTTDFSRLTTSKNQKAINMINPDYSTDYLCHQTLIYAGKDRKKVFKKLKKMSKYCADKYKSLRVDPRLFQMKVKSGDVYDPHGPNFISKVRLIPDYENDNFKLTFGFKGEKMALPVVLKSDEINPTRAMKENERFYKGYTRGLKQTIRLRRKNKSKLQDMLVKQEKMLKVTAQDAEINRQRIMWENRVFMDEQANAGSIVRSFTINSFGLFNCDAIRRMLRPFKMNRDFVNAETKEPLDGKVTKVVVIDEDKNGVLSYEGGEDKFTFDKAAKSTIVVFLSATMVGIYKSVRDKIRDDRMELKLLDISAIKNQDFVSAVMDE